MRVAAQMGDILDPSGPFQKAKGAAVSQQLCLLKTSNALSRRELCLPELSSSDAHFSQATARNSVLALPLFRSRATLQLENLALRHQIGVLRRSARKRPKLSSGDRLLWLWLSHI
jgi:hypothetical protein